MPYFAPLWTSLDHLCIHYVHIVYITALFPHCILSATIFPISTIFSPSFFGFSSAIFFSISIYCGFTSFYHYAALVVPFCTWLCFFIFSSLFWCRNLFLVRITPFSKPCYISVYRLLFCLIILRCLCVVTSWFAIITFPVSAYIDSLRARTSMLVDPQHQYIVFLKQFLKGGFYTGKISYRTLHLCLHGNALPLSQKRDFRPAQFVAATGSIQKKIWKQRFFHGKKEVSTCLFWLIGL